MESWRKREKLKSAEGNDPLQFVGGLGNIHTQTGDRRVNERVKDPDRRKEDSVGSRGAFVTVVDLRMVVR